MYESFPNKKENFGAENAFAQESSVFERFTKGKAGKVARLLAIVSALSLAPALANETYAGEQKSDAKIEQVEKTQQGKTIELLGTLFDMRTPKDTSSIKNLGAYTIMKKEAARALIQNYAREKAGKEKGAIVDAKDIKAALEELDETSGLFADLRFGNKDGKADAEEMMKLIAAQGGSFGFEALGDMLSESP